MHKTAASEGSQQIEIVLVVEVAKWRCLSYFLLFAEEVGIVKHLVPVVEGQL